MCKSAITGCCFFYHFADVVVDTTDEVRGVCHTTKIANSVTSRFSPILSPAICVGSNDESDGFDAWSVVLKRDAGSSISGDAPRRAVNSVFGVYEDGVCTPISLPWLSVTLMDFDCGSRRSECERVTSSEHLHYEAGSNVDVHIIGPLLRSRTISRMQKGLVLSLEVADPDQIEVTPVSVMIRATDFGTTLNGC